ncbi:hemolysin family protein [Acetivibrio straminisolvens]|uniref:Hemolysin and related protein containing CBS domains n=1 Tax=Acetivibrio straminisolvens JCM 21531 TaxID=1294263 RepID=W4V514_9FIRM|nr:hemolysin family protein [Acetivibrio straminisolvens]GAE88276.1 hemolysin and related protein containing CBS domains [Acetivibrio straminisolvens JCM 21531]
MFIEILVLVLLIVLNGFFAASEIALISLNDNKLRMMGNENNKKKIAILRKLLSEPGRFLATIQIGITLGGTLSSAFASESFSDRLAGLVKQMGVPVPDAILKTLSMIFISVILSYFSLVIGELVPKRLAMKEEEAISMFAAKPLYYLSVITYPVVRLLNASTNLVVRLFGIDPNADEEEVTEEEIRMMVDVGEEKGAIQENEREMINNIFDFDNKTVMDIMTHRTDIIALPVDASLDDVMSLFIEEKYTRIPVYDESIDNIVGILHVKDLIKYIGSENNTKNFDLREIIRKPYNVPWSKKADELFSELQKNKVHMAVIVDEYGGTAGIATIEDLVEEIVGNIFDEYDEEEKDFEKLDESTYIFNGSAGLDVLNEWVDAELPEDEYDTLSGFVISQLGRIPNCDEKPQIEFNGLVFKVEEVSEKRIEKIKVCRA